MQFGLTVWALRPLGIGPAAATGGDPEIVEVTTTDTTATVTYTGSVTHYRLDGGTAVAIGSSPYTITGLTADTEYTIEIGDGASTWYDLTSFGTTNTGSGGGDLGDGSALISVPVGTLTLTGFEPTVIAAVSVSVPAGVLTLTGFAPTVAAGSTASISVPAGTLTLTGFAPTITTAANPITVSIPAGTLTLTGFAPSFQSRAPQLGARLDEYPRLPANPAQLSVKLTELFSKTNLRVNELSQGFLWASWNATALQPASTSGAWGDTVRNSRPIEEGSPGSKYIVVGWIRLETDWSPMRVLTGN